MIANVRTINKQNTNVTCGSALSCFNSLDPATSGWNIGKPHNATRHYRLLLKKTLEKTLGFSSHYPRLENIFYIPNQKKKILINDKNSERYN